MPRSRGFPEIRGHRGRYPPAWPQCLMTCLQCSSLQLPPATKRYNVSCGSPGANGVPLRRTAYGTHDPPLLSCLYHKREALQFAILILRGTTVSGRAECDPPGAKYGGGKTKAAAACGMPPG